MDHLWSPWRLQYVTGGHAPPGCVFCTADTGTDPGQAALVVHRGTMCFVILNLFPYNNGHLMVVPGRHIATLAEATPDELHEMMQLTQRAEIVLRTAYQPHGINVGINIGRAAGAGLAEHLHIHLVPRWNGDTNFMTTVGESRVLPESLDATAIRLRPLFVEAAAAAL
ncbi:AP-4-A phosphorylase [Luteitalea pratensis]|uniref:AP-4-A phosphorylase n=1 Tax=Luteitalea pratensis TaxID=1855912 RepID=A0A143PSX7_LUTPR|nr:HIT domain-containing protein [Luteitalea pratensis]AMY11263.1 AP-4-A phosphorylase [Luteitalea pratensis]